MTPNPTTPAATRSTKNHEKAPESRSQNIEQESSQNNSKTDGDASSSWNVVVAKRHHISSALTQNPVLANISKKHSQKPKSDGPHNIKPRHAKQHIPQQHAKINTNNNSASAKSHPNNANNRKSQQKNKSNENAMKKGKPKPKAMTVGDMIPVSKKKKINKDSNKKVSQQQQQQQQENKNQNPSQNPYQRHQQLPPQQPQNYPNLHTDSVQDFPVLGASSGPTSPQPPVPVASKKGWGAVSKPPPSATFRSEAKASNKSIRDQNNNNNRQSQGGSRSFTAPSPEPTPLWSISPSNPNQTNHKTRMQQKQYQPQPTRVLKRGEALSQRGSATTAAAKGAPNKKKKAKPTNSNPTPNIPPSAASFFQPRARNLTAVSDLSGGAAPGRDLDGEEHQLLRLVQERNVYQKKGRQRVAPRKKKFTALKKKVLQERLDQWRVLHPEEVPSQSSVIYSGSGGHDTNPLGSGSTEEGGSKGMFRTRSLCLYNYAEPDELEEEDEYEEILENLTSMARKIGPIEEVFLPRSSVQNETDDTSPANSNNNDESESDRPYRHPVFLLFKNESDASAALACWRDWMIGGSQLEVFGLEVQDETCGASSAWSERALAAESKTRNEPEKAKTTGESRTLEVLLQKVLAEDDYDDEDCMSESLEDLKKIALRFGAVGTIRAAGTNGDVLVTYENTSLEVTRGIAQDLCRVVVGGKPLYASVRELPTDPSEGSAGPPTTTTLSTLLLENVLTEDDLQDSDCLQESLNDVKELCLRYGTVSNVVAKGSAVKVTYRDNGDNTRIAQTAADELDGIILGGNTVRASVLITSESDDNPLDHSIDVHNLLTEDDVEDEDCMEESLGDVRELASTYGEVVSVNMCKVENDSTNYVRIRFGGDDPSVVARAVEGFSGMVIGGQIVSASLSATGSAPPEATEATNPGDKRKPTETPLSTNTSKASDMKKARTDDKAPLYSGDKLISERFAEMKRVPKIPNKEGPRAYASGASTDERIKPLLAEMLGELMRLQKRAIEDKNAKARRRMVMGLREVARGIRAHKGTYAKQWNSSNGIWKSKFAHKLINLSVALCVVGLPVFQYETTLCFRSQNGRYGQQPGPVRGYRRETPGDHRPCQIRERSPLFRIYQAIPRQGHRQVDQDRRGGYSERRRCPPTLQKTQHDRQPYVMQRMNTVVWFEMSPLLEIETLQLFERKNDVF
jgi:hypothetical protein